MIYSNILYCISFCLSPLISEKCYPELPICGEDPFFFVNRRTPDDLSIFGRGWFLQFNIRRKFFRFDFFASTDYMPIEIMYRRGGSCYIT